MIPFGLSSLMTVSMPMTRRLAKCLVPGYRALYWCNEGAGQVLTDHSGNGYDGTLGSTAGADTNDPAWGAAGLVFDGTDNFVTVGTAAGLDVGNGDFTLLAAVTPTSNAGGRYLLGKNAGGSSSRWEIGGAAGKWRAVHVSAAGAVVKADADTAYTNGTTYLVTGTRSGNTLSLYIGTAVQAAPGTIAAAASTAAHPLTIGAGPAGTDPLAGTLHVAAIWPFALTPAQVTQTHGALKAALAARGVVLT